MLTLILIIAGPVQPHPADPEALQHPANDANNDNTNTTNTMFLLILTFLICEDPFNPIPPTPKPFPKLYNIQPERCASGMWRSPYVYIYIYIHNIYIYIYYVCIYIYIHIIKGLGARKGTIIQTIIYRAIRGNSISIDSTPPLKYVPRAPDVIVGKGQMGLPLKASWLISISNFGSDGSFADD